MHRAIDIGQVFLDLAKSANGKSRSLTPFHILKFVYFAHSWMLAINGKRLISEDIEAWRYGPVVPELYYEIKGYGRGEITKNISKNFDIKKLTKEERDVIEETFDVYKDFSVWDLSKMTHIAGTPWDLCKKKGLYVIPEEMLRSYHEKLGLEA